VGIGFERLAYFIFTSTLFMHIMTCVNVIIAKFNQGISKSWIDNIDVEDNFQQYLTSFYWIVQTITTVGYGDIDLNSNIEMIFCIVVMIIGVLSFSYSSASLASILQNYDS
jgi:hypothetical protein